VSATRRCLRAATLDALLEHHARSRCPAPCCRCGCPIHRLRPHLATPRHCSASSRSATHAGAEDIDEVNSGIYVFEYPVLEQTLAGLTARMRRVILLTTRWS